MMTTRLATRTNTDTATRTNLATRVNTALALVGAAFITYIGVRYLTVPAAEAPGFGMPVAPTGAAADFLNVKGVRDLASALLIVTLLATRQRRALGTALLVTATIPVGDMLTILRHGGSTAMAFGVHGLTAALVAATGILFLRERR
ncbi:DUF4267 domain-containing protein [Nocardia sp. CDC153]|uniref:DUF4267 domain-containing protein n=1 Tax=Nocardia sp. CDC153 TaxID=3112167 RepID=UPI002DB6F915|nr:DUF4267 domain-containing protein [Nocardia sp. CDC153]MEC3952251.1 DUF4267 domain-containing protein [Nocardia sp. CDC153]